MSDAPDPDQRGYVDVGCRLPRGEGLELVSSELGVTATTLSGWRDDFLSAGQTALKSRPADDRDEEVNPRPQATSTSD
jgi:hypothetical protein